MIHMPIRLPGVHFRPGHILCVLLLAITLGGCEKIEGALFNAAIGLERMNAGLDAATTTVDDVSYAYLKNDWKNDQETIVLLHGFSADKDNWTRFAGAFGAGYNLMIPDLAGHGETTQDMDLAYDTDTQARRVLSLMTALEVEKFHLVGSSMGGAITARAAWLAPGRVLSAALFNPSGAHMQDSDFDAALKEGINPLLVKKPGDMDRVIAYAMAQPPFFPWPVKSVMARKSMARTALNEKIFDDLNRDNGRDQTNILPEVITHTLVVWGDKDRILHVADADLFVSLMPLATKVVMTDIGHLPMMEAPDESARIYRTFVDGN